MLNQVRLLRLINRARADEMFAWDLLHERMTVQNDTCSQAHGCR